MKGNRATLEKNKADEVDAHSIVVHSHLKWDWVWQRPQQFLSRLSRKHRVLFVETPDFSEDVANTRFHLREVSDFPKINVLQTILPAARRRDTSWIDKERRRVVQSVLSGPLGQSLGSIVQWFYDPMAVTGLAGQLQEELIVYDCMDELSLFRAAPPELVRRERELLAVADVVFAGGPKIWKAKRELNANCFCYGCGVDAKHFAKACEPQLQVPHDITGLPRPVFGYIGVVDERIDYELLAHLADSTRGSVVMLGPSIKVEPASFPRRENLHWLGGRDYSDLPRYAKGFDVCLMPFAMNEATRFINPTKALEYMATGRPIVSTPIEDVVTQFSDVIMIAENVPAFINACERAAARPDSQRIERGLALARRNSWESIVASLEQHIQEALHSRRALNMSAA